MKPRGRISEQMVDAKKLGEGAALGVGFLSGENGVAQRPVLSREEVQKSAGNVRVRSVGL